MPWKSWRHTGLMVWFGLSLVACAPTGPWSGPEGTFTPYPPRGFTHEVSSSVMELFWNCTRPLPDTLVLEGLAFNPWSASAVRWLEFALVGENAQGASVSETGGDPQDYLLGSMRSTPFHLELRTTGSEVRFNLFYRFQFVEPGEGGGDGHESPKSRLPGGGPPVQLVAAGPILLAQANNYLMVWDACSEYLHRMR
jgi:hypothetical protein